MKPLFILILSMLAWVVVAWGQVISDADGVAAIMGEAYGQSYECKLAHASAIRNRGTLNGVYGTGEYKKRLAEAKRAWEESKTNRTTDADYWGSIRCDQKWIATMKKSGYLYRGTIDGEAFFKKPKTTRRIVTATIIPTKPYKYD